MIGKFIVFINKRVSSFGHSHNALCSSFVCLPTRFTCGVSDHFNFHDLLRDPISLPPSFLFSLLISTTLIILFWVIPRKSVFFRKVSHFLFKIILFFILKTPSTIYLLFFLMDRFNYSIFILCYNIFNNIKNTIAENIIIYLKNTIT